MRSERHPIEKKIKTQLYLTLLLYTLLGYVAVMIVDFIFSQFSIPVFGWLHFRIDVVYILYLIIGFCCIFNHYWKKPWDYLNEVISATETVYEQNDHTIELSEPLRKIESQMNQIKMSVLLSQKAAKEAEDKKNELVMYLAHDIRTPLTTVIGYLSLLDEAPDMPDLQKEKYVGIALEKAERLEKLINELFEITRYHTQRIKIKKESVDLYCMLVQVIDEFYPILSSRGNTAKLHADKELTVSADPEKLARVFNNLLKNATAYSYPNTDIDIYAERDSDKFVINFQNHGQTIPPEQLSAMFEKFNRLDEARMSDTGGSGLGLSIAEEIVHLHGGEITAKSENDRITFILSLPAFP